jgi:hypothetical protein
MKLIWNRKEVTLGLAGLAGLTGLNYFNSDTLSTLLNGTLISISAVLIFALISATSKFSESSWWLNPLFVTLVILVSFFIKLSNQERWLILLLFSVGSLAIYRNRVDLKKFSLNIFFYSTVLFSLKILTIVFSKVPDHLLQFLSLGYDNAFHFAIFRYFRAEPWFPFSSQKPWGTDFGLFNTYPSGQSAFWSFLAEPIIGNNLDSGTNLIVFGVVNLFILVFIFWLIFRCIQNLRRGSIFDLVFAVISSLVISIGYVGIFFTNGFPPYAAGILILLLHLVTKNWELDRTSSFLSPFFAVLILLLTTPALIAFLILPGLVSTLNYFKVAFASRSFLRIGLMFFLSSALTVLGYFFQSITSSNFGWRQILLPGGVIPPNKFVVFILVTATVFVIAVRWRSIFAIPIFQLTISGALSVLFLSIITMVLTGSVQYYAVKQLHVWLVFGGISLAVALMSLGPTRYIDSLLRISLIFLLVIPLITSTSVRSAWMGNLIGVINATVDKSKWDSQIVNVGSIKAGLDATNTLEDVSAKCLILRTKGLDSDLNSRWINALNVNPSISDNCFTAFWNSGNLTRNELELRLIALEGNFLILSDSDDEPKAAENSNIEYIRIEKQINR